MSSRAAAAARGQACTQSRAGRHGCSCAVQPAAAERWLSLCWLRTDRTTLHSKCCMSDCMAESVTGLTVVHQFQEQSHPLPAAEVPTSSWCRGGHGCWLWCWHRSGHGHRHRYRHRRRLWVGHSWPRSRLWVGHSWPRSRRGGGRWCWCPRARRALPVPRIAPSAGGAISAGGPGDVATLNAGGAGAETTALGPSSSAACVCGRQARPYYVAGSSGMHLQG
jgi:hypothetical protein